MKASQMLTREQVLATIRAGRASECLDNRDYDRLARFFPVDELPELYVEITPAEAAAWKPVEWTREAVLKELREDVAFGFKKALSRRSISARMMYATVLMWMWVLEDELQHQEFSAGYTFYGLPLLKAVALKYGFPNAIGDDSGSESKYSDEIPSRPNAVEVKHGISVLPSGHVLIATRPELDPPHGHRLPVYRDPSFAFTERLLLEREAALILEQEGWIVERTAHETSSRRMRAFGERYRAWQAKVDQFRAANPEPTWPKPPDNS
jgi:hypothetical protein